MKKLCFIALFSVGGWVATANAAWLQNKSEEMHSIDIAIARPGVVAVDAVARRDELTTAGTLGMCGGSVAPSAARILNTVDAPEGYGQDERYTRIGKNFRQLGAICLGGLESACTKIQDSAIARANEPEYFKTGVDQWFITLDSMRRNGSLPIETRRGARALYYHGRTLSGLMQLAERAAVQTIDLYAHAPSEEKTIHRAVEFFIDAVENPKLVLKYARTNKSPGPSKNYKVQDLGGMGSTMGWIAPYVRRFPDHANTRRLMARRLPGHSEPESYLTSQLDRAVASNGFSAAWTGVDARCFYADPQNG